MGRKVLSQYRRMNPIVLLVNYKKNENEKILNREILINNVLSTQ